MGNLGAQRDRGLRAAPGAEMGGGGGSVVATEKRAHRRGRRRMSGLSRPLLAARGRHLRHPGGEPRLPERRGRGALLPPGPRLRRWLRRGRLHGHRPAGFLARQLLAPSLHVSLRALSLHVSCERLPCALPPAFVAWNGVERLLQPSCPRSPMLWVLHGGPL